MMLIAIAAVVIIGIILAVVMMKKKGEAPTASTPIAPKVGNRPKTLAEQQQERETQTQVPQPAPVAPTPVDSLITAQNLVDKKDYPTAITTLKSAITAQPNRSDLQLLLLNIYAQQNNHSDFYNQYDNLMTLNDPSAHAQASKLKALIDEEHAFQTNKSMPTTAPLVAAAVATTATVMATSSHAEPATVADSIDFDSLEMDSLNSFQAPPPVVIDKSAPALHSADNDLSFDFDLETDTTATMASTSQSSLHNETLSSSEPILTLDTASSKVDDDFTFDLSDEITPSSHATPVVAETRPTTVETVHTPVEEESFDFEDFNLELPTTSPVEAHVTPAQPVAVETNTTNATGADDDFDFDLSFDEPKTTTTVYAPTATTEPLLATELSTEDTHHTSVAHEISAESEKAVALDDDFNFDLEDLSPATPSQPVVNTTAITPPTPESLAPETAFALPTDKTEEAFSDLSIAETPAPVSTSVEEISPALLVTAPVLATAVSQAVLTTDSSPVVSTTSTPLAEQQDFSPAFEVVKGLDNHQVTLELAEQYIQLGEYDSAKRLLNEVHTASPAHQQTASRLLASID